MKAIFTRYHAPGNTASRRVSATDKDGNRIYSQWDDGLAMDDNHDAAAKALCVKCGWTDAPLDKYGLAGRAYGVKP